MKTNPYLLLALGSLIGATFVEPLAAYELETRGGILRANFYYPLTEDLGYIELFSYRGALRATNVASGGGLVATHNSVTYISPDPDVPMIGWNLPSFGAASAETRRNGLWPSVTTALPDTGSDFELRLAGPPDFENAAAARILLAVNEVLAPGAPSGTPDPPALKVAQLSDGVILSDLAVGSGIPVAGNLEILDSLTIAGVGTVLLIKDTPGAPWIAPTFYCWALTEDASEPLVFEIPGIAASSPPGSLALVTSSPIPTIACATRTEILVFHLLPDALGLADRDTFSSGSSDAARVACNLGRIVILQGEFLHAYEYNPDATHADYGLEPMWPPVELSATIGSTANRDLAVGTDNNWIVVTTKSSPSAPATIEAVSMGGRRMWSNIMTGSEGPAVPPVIIHGSRVYAAASGPTNSLTLNEYRLDLGDLCGEIGITSHATSGSSDLTIAFQDNTLYLLDVTDGTAMIHVIGKRFANIARAEIEVTQAIQNLHNEVPLVEQKPTLIRVHSFGGPLHSDGDWELYPGVTHCATITAEITVEALVGAEWKELTTDDESKSEKISDRIASRRDIDSSFNFEIGGDLIPAGRIRISAEVDPGDLMPPDTSGPVFASVDLAIQPMECPCLISYLVTAEGPPDPSDPSSPGEALTPDVDFVTDYGQTLLRRAAAPLPIPEFEETAVQGTLKPLHNEAFNLEHNAWKVLSRLNRARLLTRESELCTTRKAFYVGWLHEGVEWDWSGMAIGWPLPRIFISKYGGDGRGMTVAHELGHSIGRRHVNCPLGEPANIDRDYPYDPCHLAVSEASEWVELWGTDWQREELRLYAPEDAADFMSYKSPDWVSDYTWTNILVKLQKDFGPSASSTAAKEVSAAGEALSMVLVQGVSVRVDSN